MIIEKTKYTPCFRCHKQLEDLERRTRFFFAQRKDFFLNFRKERVFIVGEHGQEKADLKKIDFSYPHEIEWATTGKVIEIQTGRKHGEIKFIMQNQRFDEQLHYIFLLTPKSPIPTLLNVYNPQEGMSFKWSKDGKYRKFLNNFRSCCPHPDDHEDNFFKEHHGRQHKLYDYQIEILNQVNSTISQ